MGETSSSSIGMYTVDSIMTKGVHSVSLDLKIADAIQLLLTHKISGAPVTDQVGRVVSVCSEGDLLKLAASCGLNRKIGECLERLPKKEKLITASKTDGFAEIYKMFLTHPVHRVIVVDGNGNLQGIVTRSNVLRILISDKVSDGKKPA